METVNSQETVKIPGKNPRDQVSGFGIPKKSHPDGNSDPNNKTIVLYDIRFSLYLS